MSSQRGTNPLNRYGKRMKCAICQSVYHWAKECLNKAASNSVKLTESETIENCNLTLFTKEHPSINEVFAIESSCSAVIDTACTRTVCGEKWFSNFLEKTCDDIPTYSSSNLAIEKS